MLIKKYLVEQLELMIPGERLMLIASTENVVPEENIIAMAELMESLRQRRKEATLPLSREVVQKICSGVWIPSPR